MLVQAPEQAQVMAECKHHATGAMKTDGLLLFNVSAEGARGYPAPGASC